MKRLTFVGLALAVMACTVQTQPDPAYASPPPSDDRVAEAPPPPPPTGVPAPSRGTRHRRPPPPPPPQPQAHVWDNKDYTFIGETYLDGRSDSAVITASRLPAAPQRLMLVADYGNVDIYDGVVYFADGPSDAGARGGETVRKSFTNNDRTRRYDILGNRFQVRRFEFKYKNPTSSRIRLQLWATTEGAPRYKTAVWDTKGYQKLAEASLDPKKDVYLLDTPKTGVPPKRLMLVVDDGNLEVTEVIVHHWDGSHPNAPGPKSTPSARHTFTDSDRTRRIDILQNKHLIRRVEIRYRNAVGNPKVQLWWTDQGGPVSQNPPPPPPPSTPPPSTPGWEQQGWVLIGEQTVGSKRDRDTIRVGRREGSFRKLLVVVEAADLEMRDMQLKLERGRPIDIAVRHFFRAGSTSREIDLPGTQSAIQWISFRYGKVSDGVNPRVKVYAR